MATPAHFIKSLRGSTNLCTSLCSPHKKKTLFSVTVTRRTSKRTSTETWASTGDSYLDLWKKAVDREKKETLFQNIAENSANGDREEENEFNPQVLERKTDEFNKLLEVPKAERDRIQQMQVIDRAAAAIAAAQALLKESPPVKEISVDSDLPQVKIETNGEMGLKKQATKSGDVFASQSGTLKRGTPGPDFWSWTPPVDIDITSKDTSTLQTDGKPAPSPNPTKSVMEKERTNDLLLIPFQSAELMDHALPLPPLQSLVEIENVSDVTNDNLHQEVEIMFSTDAEEAAYALHEVEEVSSQGVYADGTKYWKETGVEQRPDGVVCRWTLTRGISVDGSVEWEEKYWEAAGQFDYKELGSEKSGRDATGSVWREYWKESMWQDQGSGLVHMEKSADKWGKNGNGGEWQEKWWEHYDASGQAEKSADKWCSLDPNTPLEAGHAHVWHERWGETYDGHGSSIKYTDKWAERLEGDGWTKWGDKWDENFNQYAHGVKQGEKWWQGKDGEKWNRTWGEHHNGSGWIHKYGKSSCGEHWDTHVQQDTWYERYPHFGFDHCFENSRHLRQVRVPPETP